MNRNNSFMGFHLAHVISPALTIYAYELVSIAPMVLTRYRTSVLRALEQNLQIEVQGGDNDICLVSPSIYLNLEGNGEVITHD